MDLRTLDQDTLARHYEEHVGKGFYADLVEFMSRGPVVAMVVEGAENTWEVVRNMMGATNPRKAAPGTIRGDLGILFTENLVHGSDSLASARARDRHLLPESVTKRASEAASDCGRPARRTITGCDRRAVTRRDVIAVADEEADVRWREQTRLRSAVTSPSTSAPPTR